MNMQTLEYRNKQYLTCTLYKMEYFVPDKVPKLLISSATFWLSWLLGGILGFLFESGQSTVCGTLHKMVQSGGSVLHMRNLNSLFSCKVI